MRVIPKLSARFIGRVTLRNLHCRKKGPIVFRVQRASVGANPTWKTICSQSSEAPAREVYLRQLKLNSTGRFRLLDPQDKILAEARAQPLFQRSERDDEIRLSTDYAPAPVSPRPG